LSTTTANLLYLVTIVAFILALRFLSSPRRARLGVQIGAAGMIWAIIVTLSLEEVVTGYWWMAAGVAIGSVIGVVGARKVKMTAMPQMVALFNGVGGGAASLISLVEFHGVWAHASDVGVERGVATVFSALVGSISLRSGSCRTWSAVGRSRTPGSRWGMRCSSQSRSCSARSP
jgi:proton-translocating NAD(P)+ transhydrogenase subunit beta